LALLQASIPIRHPSTGVLGDERVGVGIAVTPTQVLTAHYLVLGAEQIELHGVSDGQPRQVETLVLDHDSGLALLSLRGPRFQPVAFDARPARPGLPSFVLSCTAERECRGATGHITGVRPFEAFWEYMLEGAILTDIVNPGLAGAPLFDDQARLLGIVSLGLAAIGRYSLAIPVELYLGQRERLEHGQPASALAPRAWIGFYPQHHEDGLIVTGLVPGGPAASAGLERGDFVLAVDGTEVSSLRELYRALRAHGPGACVRLSVRREGQVRALDIVAGNRHEFYK
jgi:hypothetical protein